MRSKKQGLNILAFKILVLKEKISMGQRSQIYIRYNIEYQGKQYKGLIARYYPWNYGERMISRARSIIEYIKDKYLEYPYNFTNQSELELRLPQSHWL